MNKKKLVISVIILTMVFMFSSMGMAFGSSSLEEIRGQQEKIKGDMSDVQSNLDQKEKEYNEIKAKADKQQEALNKAQAEAEEAAAKVEAIKANIESQKENLGDRLRTMYKNGSVGFINVVLDSNNMEEFLSNMSMVQEIYKNDQKTLDNLNKQHKALETEKANLQEKKAEIESAKAELDKQKADLESKKAEYKAEYDKLQAEYDNLEADAQSITAVINSSAGAYENSVNNSSDSTSDSGSSSSDGGSYGGGALSWPVSGPVTSEFGYRIHPVFGDYRGHTGIDIGVPTGTPVHAAADGVVIYSGGYGGYGNVIMIDHGGGLVTLYAHNSSLAVSVGQNVSRGEVVAYAGSTGWSTGPHCHFEVRSGGQPVNPRNYL